VEFLPGSLPPVHDELEIGRWIPFGSFGHISCVGYKPAPAPVERAMILPIGRIHVFVGVISSNNPDDAPILEELDDSGNTIGDEEGDSDDDANSIFPVLDYESNGDSIGLVSDGTTTPATVYMTAPASNGSGPTDPSAQHMPDPNVCAPPGFGPSDVLATPITATTPEDLEAICRSLQAEQDRQCAERDRLRLELTAANAVSEYQSRRTARLQGGHRRCSLDQVFANEDPTITAEREQCRNTQPGGSTAQQQQPNPPPCRDQHH
jgi:hypothetical protein